MLGRASFSGRQVAGHSGTPQACDLPPGPGLLIQQYAEHPYTVTSPSSIYENTLRVCYLLRSSKRRNKA